MKKMLFIVWLALSLTMIYTPQEASARQSVRISFQTFYDELSPYGVWISYPEYGYAWRPRVDIHFRPYLSNGQWVFTEEGWFWKSDYDWGWAPFHYGRWIYDEDYGWLWIPGYEWAPAWVTWGYVDGYYGWAPLMPGIGINISFSNWRPHPFYWNIVPSGRLCDRDLFHFHLSSKEARRLGNRLNIIHNFRTPANHRGPYSMGPGRDHVKRNVHRDFNPVKITDNPQRDKGKLENNEIRVYRPNVRPDEPEQSRRVDRNKTKPVVNNGRWPKNPDDQKQNENINRLPEKKPSDAPQHRRR